METSRGSRALSLLRSAWRGRRASAEEAGEAKLSASDRAKVLQVVQLGCPRATAANYVGLSGEQFEQIVLGDEAFARELLRAEAEAAVRHMGNVHKASKDEKNWRTSVWWLEQHGLAPIDAEEGAADYPEAVLTALDRFAELIVAEIPDVMRRQTLLTKLLHIALQSVEPAVVIEAEPVMLEGVADGGDRVNSRSQGTS
jgi:hypothetical protein